MEAISAMMLLDTDVLIDCLRGLSATDVWLRESADQEFAIALDEDVVGSSLLELPDTETVLGRLTRLHAYHHIGRSIRSERKPKPIHCVPLIALHLPCARSLPHLSQSAKPSSTHLLTYSLH